MIHSISGAGWALGRGVMAAQFALASNAAFLRTLVRRAQASIQRRGTIRSRRDERRLNWDGEGFRIHSVGYILLYRRRAGQVPAAPVQLSPNDVGGTRDITPGDTPEGRLSHRPLNLTAIGARSGLFISDKATTGGEDTSVRWRDQRG